MLIISQSGTEFVFTGQITHGMAGDNGKLVCWVAHGKPGGVPDVFLGQYRNGIEAGRALQYIADRYVAGDYLVRAPGMDEPWLAADDTLRGGGLSHRKGRTTGKTK